MRSANLKPRIILAVILVTLLLLLFAFLTSTSSNGVLSGQWSIPVLSASVILLLACGFVIRFLAGSDRVLNSAKALLSKCPDFLTSLLLIVPLLIFFIVWFLFPIPILRRTSFTIGAAILAISPGLLIIVSYPPKQQRSAILGTVTMSVSLLIALLLS
ncbi:MAG: hypothetical protein ABFR50_05205, partial [Candidatus Fermentibacteria bacterium]